MEDRWCSGRRFSVDAGDSVLVAVLQKATGKASGIGAETRCFQLWTLCGGRVIRLESIKERAEALEAAGVSP